MIPISIILPIYNASKHLDECLESILRQTFRKFELIIIDDGSTDDSLIKVKGYTDDRVIIIQNEHNFIESLNLGISAARGKYIVRMDADDIMMPNRLDVQYNYMETYPGIDVCGSSYEIIGERTKIAQQKLTQTQIISAFILHNPLCHPSIIMKKELIYLFSERRLYNKNYLYAEDYKLWIDLAIKGCKFSVLPDILLKYRISDQQTTFLHLKEMQEITLKIQREYITHVSIILSKHSVVSSNLVLRVQSLLRKQLIDHKRYQQLLFSLYSEILEALE